MFRCLYENDCQLTFKVVSKTLLMKLHCWECSGPFKGFTLIAIAFIRSCPRERVQSTYAAYIYQRCSIESVQLEIHFIKK